MTIRVAACTPDPDRLLSPILRRDGDRDTGPQPEEDEPRPSP